MINIKSVRNYHCSLHNNPEECSSQVQDCWQYMPVFLSLQSTYFCYKIRNAVVYDVITVLIL